MARASARKKTKKEKSISAARAAKKRSSKPAFKPSRRDRNRASPKTRKAGSTAKRRAKTQKSVQHPVRKGSSSLGMQSRKAETRRAAPPSLGSPPRLLRHTKTTAAALALMEKGIGHIYKKDFKKARAELKTLLESYSSETEIVARARTYIRICDREEAARKRPPIPTDQLYALGVLEHNKGNYEEAISYFRRSLENHPEADYVYYSAAASLAMKGDLDGALDNLKKAIALNEDSRIYAKNDSDFAALQARKEFAGLLGLMPTPAAEVR